MKSLIGILNPIEMRTCTTRCFTWRIGHQYTAKLVLKSLFVKKFIHCDLLKKSLNFLGNEEK